MLDCRGEVKEPENRANVHAAEVVQLREHARGGTIPGLPQLFLENGSSLAGERLIEDAFVCAGHDFRSNTALRKFSPAKARIERAEERMKASAQHRDVASVGSRLVPCRGV